MNTTQSAQRMTPFTFFVICFACLGGVLYGYDIGVINGALGLMNKDLHLTHVQLSFIVAAVLGGGCIATLFSGSLADVFGRRMMVRLSAVIFIFGVAIILGAHEFYTALIGRFIQGIGVGIITIVIPLYLTESTPARIRGRVISLFQLLLTSGILIAFVIGRLLIGHGSWRYMFMTILVPAVILFLGSFVITESPRWLYNRGKKKVAAAILRKTCHETELTQHLEQMEKLYQHQAHVAEVGFFKGIGLFFTELSQRRYLIPFLIALSIACLGQLTGVNSILQFSTLILGHSGIPSDKVSMMGTIGVGLLNFIFTFIAILLIDKVGRKLLLSIGTFGVLAALVYCGFISLMPNTMTKGILLIIGLMVYITFFAVGPGVVVWLVISELIPMPIRGAGMSVCLFFNSAISSILAALVMPISVWTGGYQGVFWLCAIFTVFYFLIAAFILPETKNKTLEEIEMYFSTK
ncbi:MAG: sugar porter family MFS transporter [Pseudomonadota bacterium]